MGYKNEYASLNKFSGMKKYFEDKIKKDIIPLIKETQKNEQKQKSIPLKYQYNPKINEVPCVAFDGGMATLFVGEPSETKILKVSAGFSEENSELFNQDYQSDNIHIFTGKLKWLDGINVTLEDAINELVEIMINNVTIKECLLILGIDSNNFKSNMFNKFFKFEGKSVEDNVREIFELSAIIVYNEKMKKNIKLIENQKNKKLITSFLIIKDGTLYPSQKTVSALFGNAVATYFDLNDNYIVGVVKSSRFVNRENSWSKMVIKYGENLASHSFYRIPDKLELSIDKHTKENHYRRLFLTIFGGESIYEIQISKTHTSNKDELEFILDGLKSQITVKYGGSIITNSYAHLNASLSESEAKFLTKELREDINQLIKEEGDINEL
jgi:hypothetical protein